MKKLAFVFALALAALLIAEPALAGGPLLYNRFSCSDAHTTCPSAPTTGTNLLEAAELNGTAATLTLIFDLSLGDANNKAQFAQMKMVVAYTEVAATAVTAVYYCSVDGTTYGQITSRAVGAGAGTLSAYTETVAAATSTVLAVIDVAGCAKFKVIFDGTGSPGATDLITVQAAATAGG